MSKNKQIFISLTLFLFSLTNLVFGQQLISGGKARDYVGEFSKKFSAGTYTVEVLKRNLPDPRTQAKIDAIIFNAQSGSFRYIRKEDGNHVLILLSYKKTSTLKIDAGNALGFEKTIKDNKLVPYVLLDKEKAELAIIYAPAASKITSRQRKDKSLYLEIETLAFKKNFFIKETQTNSK